MNWSKIKLIMIYFLFGMNVFILAFTAVITYRENKIPESVVSSSLQVLAERGFSCDESLFPDYIYSLPDLSAEFFSASELSDMFFGRQIPFRTSGDSLIARENYATLTVKNNFFSYESSVTPTDIGKKDKLRLLKKLGIDMSSSVYDEKSGYFHKMYKQGNLFDMYIKIEADSAGNIALLNAQWPKSVKPHRARKQFSITEYVPKIWQSFDNGTITGIEPGYRLTLRDDAFVFKPAWRVTVNKKTEILH